MPGQEGMPTISLPAAADYSGSQFCAMGIDSSGRAVIVDGSSSPAGVIIGILQNKPSAAGRPASIQIAGRSKMRAAGALATIGTKLTSDSAGEAKAYTTTDCLVGIQLSTCGAANDLIDVLIQPFVFID